ncbi:MAG TPA: pentapeptide repeat-containing protein [Acholeplasma sp.]|nr:pentapeptide repeat-containing protein [Acholeplasma sp.]
MTKKRLDEILLLHKKWLDGIDGGVRADLSKTNLRYANLRYVDLSYADLSKTNLRYVDLRYVDLSYADLRGANLMDADLRYVDLSYADLRGADLMDADLSGAALMNTNLSSADLRGANLMGANLMGAALINTNLSGATLMNTNLNGADLRGANLMGANLMGANLMDADLTGVIFNYSTSFFALQCPEKGSFTAFKKAGNYVIELLIPASAKRSSATLRKCRASKAKVVAIYNLDGTKSSLTSIESDYDGNFIYEIGKTIEVKDFDDDRWNKCSTGIHFFITFEEAKRYYN